MVKNAPIYETNFVFATLIPLASSRSNTSQQSNGNVRHMSQIEKGTASKRTASPIHARKSSIDIPVAGMFFFVSLSMFQSSCTLILSVSNCIYVLYILRTLL